VDLNSRTAYVLVAMFVVMLIAFVASIYGLVFHEWA
jgi:hypothetical protein